LLKNLLHQRGISAGGKRTVQVVLKPDDGTEGVLARSFRLQLADERIVEDSQLAEALQHLEAIGQRGGDAVAEEERGNVTCGGGKRVVLRVNVCETPEGYRGETGLARVAGAPGEVIVSQANGATREDINRILSAIEWNGKPLRECLDSASLGALINDTVAQLKASACRAAAALKIRGIAGLDFVLEADADRDGNISVNAVFLEANARPALLSAAREIPSDLASEEPEMAGSLPMRSRCTPGPMLPHGLTMNVLAAR